MTTEKRAMPMSPANHRTRSRSARPAMGRPSRAGGFTIIELLVVIGVIALLMGVLIAGAVYAMRAARRSTDITTVAGLKQSIVQFKQNFGFFPPLVKEPDRTTDGPLNTAKTAPWVFDFDNAQDVLMLRGESQPITDVDPRASNSSLTFYLLGVLGKMNVNDPPLDGVDGPGFCEVNKDGTFKKKGRQFQPLFDISKKPDMLVTLDVPQGRYSLRDRHGTPFRYYRWLPDANPNQPPNKTLTDQLNIPVIVGDPETNVEIRSATWAIVGAGPNKAFGDEKLADLLQTLNLPADATLEQAQRVAREDNVVEVGR